MCVRLCALATTGKSTGEKHSVLAFCRLQDSGCVELHKGKVLLEEVLKSDSRQHWGAAELPKRNTYKNTHTQTQT